jgi:hypothetical protein
MSLSRKQALNELQTMFPDYERSALDTLLRANGKTACLTLFNHLDNMLNATIEYVLSLGGSGTNGTEATTELNPGEKTSDAAMRKKRDKV